jgi:hypothetical protein
MKTFFCLVVALFVFVPTTARAQVRDTPVPPTPDGRVDTFDICIHAPAANPYMGLPESPDRYTFCNQSERYTSNRRFYGSPYSYGGPSGYARNFPGLGYEDYLFFLYPCPGYLPEQSQDPKCVAAEIKFDIDNSGLKRREPKLADTVSVRIEGHLAGEIGKYSHRHTSGLRLRADKEYQMTLEWRTKDGVKTVVETIQPMSMRMQDGAYWYSVSKDLFAEAPYGQLVTPERERIGGKRVHHRERPGRRKKETWWKITIAEGCEEIKKAGVPYNTEPGIFLFLSCSSKS